MLKKLFMRFALLACCLSVVSVWGKSFSIDLRTPTAKTAKQIRAKSNVIALPQGADGTLRKVNLAARAADVGVVAVGDELTFTLFDDVTITLTLKKKMPSPLGGDVFIAEASGYDGVKNAVVINNGAGLSIDVQDYAQNRVWKVLSSASGVIVQEICPQGGGTCGTCRDGQLCIDDKNDTASAHVTNANEPKLSHNEVPETYPTVDILVAYDTDAAEWAKANGGGIETFAEMAVQKMNVALVNSGIGDQVFTFRLVGTYEISGSAYITGKSSGELVNNAVRIAREGSTLNGISWAGVGEKRDEVGADIVTVLIDTRTATGTTGTGYSLTRESSGFSAYAYNCCSIRSVAESHTMTHECGHNMGAGHSDTQADDPGPQYFSYSSGYYFTKGGVGYHTIMAYDTDGYTSMHYTGIPYFSNPNAYYEGTLVGDQTHNNALTLRETCGIVAAFRKAKDTQPEEDDEAVGFGEFFGFNWRTGKSHPWTFYKDNDFMTSWDFRRFDESGNALSPNQGASWIETEISGPCDFGFLVSAYYMNGPITVSLDGEEVCRKVPHKFTRPYRSSYSVTYGDDAIEWLTVQVPEGVHTVRLSFVADGWFCGYDVYNGLTLYDVCLSKKGYRPIITPASSYSEDCATTFSNSCVVTITNSVPGSTIYYTLDDTWPTKESMIYTGPFVITNSLVVKAVSEQADGSLTMSDVSLLLERHKVQPGEWTPDADGALEAAKADGNMVLVRFSRSLDREYDEESGWAQYVKVTENEDFLAWAKSNKVYLIENDFPMFSYTRPIHFEYHSADFYSMLLEDDLGTSSVLMFARGWTPYKAAGSAPLEIGAKVGDVLYDGTASSLIAILEQYFEERPTNKYVNVRFRLEGGEMADTNRVYKSGEPFGTLPTPKCSDDYFGSNCYRFNGWYAYDNGEWARTADYGTITVESEDIVPYSDVELIAQWEYAGVSVVFMDGEYPIWSDYVPGEAYEELPPDPWRDGHTFTGWYTDPVGGEKVTVDSILPISATDCSVTNYARWTANEYTVTFDANGGAVSPTERSVDYGAAIGTLPTPTLAGYTFDGWFTELVGGEAISAATEVLGDVTCYAHWSVTPPSYCTITLDANGGSVSPTTRAVTSGAAVGTLPTPTRSGYTFDGWFTAANGGTKVSASTAVTGNVTYYAHWTANGGGSGGGDTPEPTPTPTPAVVFAGTLDVAFAKAQMVDGALYKGNALAGTVQVKVGKINKKGVVKVSATASMLIDGKVKKVTAKAVNVTLDATGRVPHVKVVFKAPIGEMAFEMAADGKFTLKNGSYLMVEATIGGTLKGGSRGTFRMDGFDLAVSGELLDDLLPNEEVFSVSNGKWTFDKAATVKWAKPKKGAARPEIYDEGSGKGLIVDEAGGKTNRSGLKLTYAAKTGQFKGSFKAYALEEKNGKTKLVKYTVNVIGFVVDGVGYGEASCKKIVGGPWAVTVE